MSFFGSMDTSASGMTAQRLRLDIISQNMANANTTRTAEGGAYKRKGVIFESVNQSNSFSNILGQYTTNNHKGVRVAEIVTDESPSPVVYNPKHPDANAEGYVEMPNVNTVDEMVNMISASRSYEANVTAFNAMKAVAIKALEIGKG